MSLEIEQVYEITCWRCSYTDTCDHTEEPHGHFGDLGWRMQDDPDRGMFQFCPACAGGAS